MGKVILEFDGVEELADVRDALDGAKWKMAMWDLDQILRSTTKYDVSMLKPNGQAGEEEAEVAEKLREKIRDILREYNLGLD